jgi:hypothetical protein
MEAAGGSWKALKNALRRRQQQQQQQQQQQRGHAQLLLSESPEVPFTLEAAGHTEPLTAPATPTAAAAAAGGGAGFGISTTLHPMLLPLDGSEAAAAAAVAQKVGGFAGRAAAARELMSHPVMLPECSEGSFTEC